MKKVVITTCAVVFTAVAAGAQGLGTVRDINSFGAEYLKGQNVVTHSTKKVQAKQVGKLAKAVQQAAIKHNREAQARASEEKAAKVNQNKSSNSGWYVYAGREGKMMALGEVFRERANAKEAAKKQEKKNAPQVKKEAKKEQKGSWIGALFGGRYPGESDEDYEYRLRLRSFPACQPFK